MWHLVQLALRMAALGAVSAMSVPAYMCLGPQPCAPPEPNEVFFVGEVVREGRKALSESELARPALFRVLDAFHGVSPSEDRVAVWGDYRKGSRWVVDAERRDGDEALVVQECTRTAELGTEEAIRFLEVLEARRAGTSPTTVTFHAESSQLASIREYGVLEVVLDGPRTCQYSMRLDNRAEQREIAPGEYFVRVFHSTHPFSRNELEPFVAVAGSCNLLGLRFGPHTRIRGRVIDQEGRLGEDARVIVARSLEGREITYTDRDGAYALDGVAPGQYTVHASKPGFRDSQTSASFEVREGLDAIAPDLQLGAEIPAAKVTLVLRNIDGKPAAWTAFEFGGSETFEGGESPWGTISTFETDYAGRYTIHTKVGALLDLTVHAVVADANGKRSPDVRLAGSQSFLVTEPNQTEEIPLTHKVCYSDRAWKPCK